MPDQTPVAVGTIDFKEDDQYIAMTNTFLATGKGRRPSLPSITPTNRLLLQFHALKEASGESWKKIEAWFLQVCPNVVTSRVRKLVEGAVKIYNSLPPGQRTAYFSLQLDLDFILKTYKTVSKDKHRKPESFSNFLKEMVSFQTQTQSSILVSDPTSTILPCKTCKKMDHDVKHLHRVLREREERLISLENSLRDSHELQEGLEMSVSKLKNDNDSLLSQMNDLKSEGEELNHVIKRQGRVIRELREGKAALSSKRKRENSELKLEINALKQESFQFSLQVNKLKKKIMQSKTMLKAAENEIRILNERIFKDQYFQEVNIKSEHNNTYSDDVRQAAIQLQAEAGVSSSNVAKVLRIVGKNIFKHNFNDHLPCTQTCINMNVEGSVLTNVHAVDTALKSKSITLHLDGTSRDHNKFVNHQISLDDGTSLFLGFSQVATEDANTILDITISLLRCLSECYSDFSGIDFDDVFKNFLKKITSTMTDRASTMKCFDKKLQDFLSSELGENVHLHFLHCNAHFLLGLSTASDKAFRTLEKSIKEETNQELGRDKEKQFWSFKKSDGETCTNRLIRTLCDILGPRGDQKNGYRAEWVEFCNNSIIPSFKSNRFNCYFEASASIIHHYQKIKSFFTSGVLPDIVNLKVKSVSADVQDRVLISLICAIAIFYVKVTGPYWMLLCSSTNYADFHTFVHEMHSHFVKWSTDPSELLSPSFQNLFGCQFSISSASKQSINNFIDDDVVILPLFTVL